MAEIEDEYIKKIGKVDKFRLGNPKEGGGASLDKQGSPKSLRIEKIWP